MKAEPKSSLYTILIAEDETLVLKMLSYRLQKEGYTVLTAIDGRQALNCLQTHTPDLIITDLMMPYHNGLEILEYVRKSFNSRIPVIVLSASGQEQTVLKAFSLGADDFALKPFSPNEIVSRIRRYLERN